jgi:ABC-type lipoprotein export system ATPase subunit
MDKLTITLENCYGIKKLQSEFDFATNGNVVAIYAPNGMMKTSLANTFRDLARDEKSSDRVWPKKKTKRTITDESGKDLKPDDVFVIEPYNESYRSGRISNLLANEPLRKRYDAVYAEIEAKAAALADILKPYTGLKDQIPQEFSDAITHDRNDLYTALTRVKEEVVNGEDSPLGDVVYTDVFNAKVNQILSDAAFTNSVEEYVREYDELLTKSTFFRKGVFTHNNAADVAKTLNTQGFFKADHSVYLRVDGEKKEINNVKDLEAAIQSEKDRILTNESLRAAFEKIDKQLNKNAELKRFRACLSQNPIVVPELNNPERLRQKLWISYLIRVKEQYQQLLDQFNKGRAEINEIIEKAKTQQTRWAEVINIFNERFSVPFVVRMENQVDVILKSVAPSLSFDFLEDAEDKKSPAADVDEITLKQVLSNGERRALYILNIIFEVEARKDAKLETLFVVDDIADSFDYKNKYAIIEYLKEVSEETCFKQIILTHNFDFYRSISGRLNISPDNRILTTKVGGAIQLEPDESKGAAPFSQWRKKLNDPAVLIASIPFLRNLAEYSGDTANKKTLTSLLHVKTDTKTITIAGLETIIRSILKDAGPLPLPSPNDLVIDLIDKVAEKIANDGTERAALEEKVVLSIAIRLRAEEYMIRRINDQKFWEGIRVNQTIELVKRFKSQFSGEREIAKQLDQVNLMTPENIHLNSFMYEPILDMSAQHLKRLYRNIANLK